MSALGEKIRELRTSRAWSQEELAKRSGIGRSYISLLETDNLGKPSADYLVRLARALNIRPEELYQAAGYIEMAIPLQPRQETSEAILERLRIAHPVSIPVYTEFTFHAGGYTEPVEYVYRERNKTPGKNVEGYLVKGDCLEPYIKDGDVIIIDRSGQIDIGDIVAGLLHDYGHLYLARLRKIADELWLENNEGRIRFAECEAAAPVIEVIRRLK